LIFIKLSEEQPMLYTIVRRDFLKCALASAVVIPALGAADARAAGLPLLDPTDPVAQSIGFVPDASKVAANATFKPGQHCGVCMQYQGKPSDATAGCGIFAGHSVPSRGWCSAFAQVS
jgi:high potential iron-sulfur protein